MANNNIFSGNNTFGNFMNNTGFITKATPTSSIISDAAKKSINDYVDSLGLQGMDKQLKIQELTQKTMEAKKQNEYNQGRADVKTDIGWKALNATNKEEAQSYKSQGKLADLADMVRGYIQKSSGKVIQGDDQEVVATFLKDNQAMVAPFASYMGGEMSAYEFAQLYGFDASPEEIATEKRNSSWRSSLTSDEGEWNDDILGHFETKSYDDAGEGFWNKAGTFGMNFLKSTYNLGSDVVNLVANPIDTVNNLSKTLVGGIMNLTTLDDYLDPNGEGWLNSANQVADGLGDILKERYGSWEGIKNTAYTDPMGMVSDIASILEGGAGLVKGVSKGAAVGTAKLGMKNIARNLDDVSKVAGDVTKVAHYSDPFNLMMEGGGKGISYVGNKAINSKRANGIKDSALNLEDSIVGLDKETKKAIQSNPYAGSTWKEVENYIDENGLPTRSQEVSKSLIADLSTSVQEDLKKYIKQFNETGPLYKSLKNGNYSVDLSGIKEKINNFLEEQGVKIGENGSLDFTDTAVTPTEASAIRRAYQWLTPDEAQPVSQYLRHRKGIDQLGLWEDAKGTPGKDILKGMREFANEEAHNQIKPLKELDKLYSEQIDLLNKATEGLVYRDKRRFGEYRDNFNQILKNMDTPNRKRLKDRLEKIIPGLEQKVEAINLMPKLIDNYYRPGKADKWLSYAGGMAGSVAGGGLPGLAIGAGVGYGLSKLYDKVKSSRWEKAISSLSEEGKNKMAEIEKAIAENKALSKEQTATLRQIGEELKANKKIKEGQIAELMGKLSEVENIDQLDGLIAEFKKIGANDAVKELEQIKEGALKNMAEQQEMDRYAKEFEAEKEKIVSDASDQRLPEFKKRIYQLQQQEKRIGAVGDKEIGKTFEGKDWKKKQNIEWLKKKEAIIKDIQDYYNVDQFESSNIFDRIERQAGPDDLGFNGKPASSKTAKYQVADDYVPTKDSTGKSLSEGQQEYFKGSKVVDEDGNLVPVYHFTADNFNTVDFKKGSQNYFWFTSDANASDRAMGVRPGQQKIRKDMYVDIKNPAGWEEYNKFGSDELKYRGYDGVILKNGDGSFEGFIFDKENQVKYTDNLNPTSSKDMRYQKYGVAGEGEKGITAQEGLNIRNFKNGKTVQELANQYGIDTKIVDSISTPEGQKAYGMYGDRLITLSKDLKESTVPHELLHGVFDMVDSKRRASILEGIQKKLNIDNVQAEEWLADNFSEYYRTGKFDVKGIPTTFVGKVRQFFQQIKEYIDGTYANRKEIGKLFDDIIDGKIEGEYGVYSDPKFQSVWHGSPYEFEKFDSSNMGKGEGAQAHGWGHYVAKDKATGEHYADMGKLPSTHYKGRAVESYYGPSIKPDEKVASSIAAKMDGGDTYKYAFNSTKNRLIEWIKEFEDMEKNGSWEDEGYTAENGRKRLQSYREELESMDNIKESDFTMGKNKHLYEVEIPDPIKKDTPTGSNYWEENRKLTNDEFEKIISELYKQDEKAARIALEIYGAKEAFLADGRHIYNLLADAMSPKEASKFLESLGYDGIHYLGGRDGEAYVIFNDDALQITKHHKY